MKLFNNKLEDTLFLNNTIIEHGMVVDAASLTGSSGLVVRGILKGRVDIDADVLIDSSGTIDGEIVCSNCMIKGRVNGNISTTGNITISQEGELFGDINCATFQIEQGGNFQGSCNKPKKLNEVKTNLLEIFTEKDEKFRHNKGQNFSLEM